MFSEETRFTRLLTSIRKWIHRYRLQLILALRVTVAAVLAFAVAQVLHLHLPLWAVLTSLIVTQMSLGRSLKVASDYLIGTFGGVAYGGALAILIRTKANGPCSPCWRLRSRRLLSSLHSAPISTCCR